MFLGVIGLDLRRYDFGQLGDFNLSPFGPFGGWGVVRQASGFGITMVSHHGNSPPGKNARHHRKTRPIPFHSSIRILKAIYKQRRKKISSSKNMFLPLHADWIRERKKKVDFWVYFIYFLFHMNFLHKYSVALHF